MGSSKKAPIQPEEAAPRRSARLFKDGTFHDHKIPIDCVTDNCDADAMHQHPPSLQFYNPRPKAGEGSQSTDQAGRVSEDKGDPSPERLADEQRRVISENAALLDRRSSIADSDDPCYGPEVPSTPPTQITHGQPPTPWAPRRLPFRSARSVRDEEEAESLGLSSTPWPPRHLPHRSARSIREDEEEGPEQYQLPGAHFLDELPDHDSMNEEEYQRHILAMLANMDREEAEAFSRTWQFPCMDS